MPRLLRFFEERQQEEYEVQRQLRHQLAVVERRQSLFKHPAWPEYEAVLRDMEKGDIEVVVGGGDDADSARERVKVVRHLLRIPQDLEAERARLTALMATEEV